MSGKRVVICRRGKLGQLLEEYKCDEEELERIKDEIGFVRFNERYTVSRILFEENWPKGGRLDERSASV